MKIKYYISATEFGFQAVCNGKLVGMPKRHARTIADDILELEPHVTELEIISQIPKKFRRASLDEQLRRCGNWMDDC